MVSETQVAEILQKALRASQAGQTEALLVAFDNSLTRYANNIIHQNVAEANASLLVRAVIGKKIGSASTNRLDDEAVRDVVARAVAIAKVQEENPEFTSLPAPKPAPRVNAWVDATAACSPEERAAAVRRILRRAEGSNLTASGAFSSGSYLMGIANSLGLLATHAGTSAALTAVVMGENSSGYADAIAADVNAIDPAAVAETAVEKCLRSANPIEVEPGDYVVILEENAVAELVNFLAFIGFGALAVQEGRSFLCDKIGQKVMDERISVWDDGVDPSGIPQPFDYEGVPKRRVVLIENGIARTPVYDTYTAAREGKESTGHALPQPNTFGPFPTHLFMSAGGSSVADMIASTERGLLVTRFHYTNVVQPKETVITGMTRDGTFLVADGAIKCGVKNLRFTQSILDALSQVERIGATRRLAGEAEWSRALVPALKITRFSFTGGTEF